MTSLISSTGSRARGAGSPFAIAVVSHKGGTGRTTAALALAWTWGQTGLQVTLIDADPIQAVSLIAANRSGLCSWQNVRLVAEPPGVDRRSLGGDIAVIDCPSLTEVAAQEVLSRVDGVILTCLADALALRTLPSATSAISRARTTNPALTLLGILLPRYDATDPWQAAMLVELRRAAGPLLIEPPIPCRTELRDWGCRPGTWLPDGPGQAAYGAVARELSRTAGIGLNRNG